MDVLDLKSLYTVGCFALFIGIAVWAFSRRKKAEFEEAAKLPLADD
jgi:cytochrome c oxidase cbb3-type subunit 4